MNRKKILALLAALSISSSTAPVFAEESAFPVEIEHAYGTTTIEEQPERVVTLFDSNSDAVLALGVAPVGISKVGYGNVEENGLLPWTNAAFEKLGVTPNVFDDAEGTDYEAVNAAEPDLVLIPNSGVTEEEYERLSQIAPTVPYAKIAYATTWEEEAEVTAKALGKEAEGAELIESTKALIAEKLAEHPELEGKTAAFCYIDPSNLSMVYIYMPLDPRAAFLEELGMKVPVRESGDVKGSAPIAIVGPKGAIYLKEGCIVAMRHIHMSPKDAQAAGVKDGDIVSVKADNERGTIFNQVKIRVDDSFTLEMHIDTDEANAAKIATGNTVTIIK